MAKFEASGTLPRFKEEAITSALGRRCLGVVTLESMHGAEGWRKLAAWSRNGTPMVCLATEASQLSSELDIAALFGATAPILGTDARVFWHLFYWVAQNNFLWLQALLEVRIQELQKRTLCLGFSSARKLERMCGKEEVCLLL